MDSTFKLTIEPEWPNAAHSAPYSLASLGGEPNQSLAASVLSPRSGSGRVSLTTRVVLRHIIWRLHNGAVRRDRRGDPAFGLYRYTWDPLEKLAIELGLSVHQVKRELECLVKGGIIYRVRRGTSEPNSYRLTDPAFKLMHLLQWPVLAYRCGDDAELASAFERSYRRWFPSWVASSDTQKMIENWHGLKTADGNKPAPDTYGFAEPIWNDSHSFFLASSEGKDWK